MAAKKKSAKERTPAPKGLEKWGEWFGTGDAGTKAPATGVVEPSAPRPTSSGEPRPELVEGAFDQDFALITGNHPFPWQRALYRRFVEGDLPTACDLPTGLGKTSVIAIWLLALVRNRSLPRRLVYVVNRRTVVDQSTAEAERILTQLRTAPAQHLRAAIDSMAAVRAQRPVAISTLRGELADNAEWRRDPARPAIVVGTVDMVGSRLLFGGYGCGFRSKPQHAGLLGQDALVVHDEAHLEPAFQSLLDAIVEEQRRCHEPRPLEVMALSATGRAEADFTLADDDLRDGVVTARLQARKGLELHPIDDRKDLPERIAAKAASLEGRVIVFLSSVEHAEKCAQALRKSKKNGVATLTGTMRGAERDALVRDPVFGRFLPRAPDGVALQQGTVFLVATSAGEVGVDLSADHLVTDLPPFDALAQRLGRVNRYGGGDAEVHVYCEALKAPAVSASSGEGSDDDEEGDGAASADRYLHARFLTRELLGRLPVRADERRDASPAALRALPRDDRLAASTPPPSIPHVDELLFDRWSYTTIREPLPGRPPVDEWLHGKAEWEPPRTTVAWRREVAWLDVEHLGDESLDDFLADYPLRARETLSDRTDRVLAQLKKLAGHGGNQNLPAWLVRHDQPARRMTLGELLTEHDDERAPTLEDATVILPPEMGGLSHGLLDGSSGYDVGSANQYDLGPLEGERLVFELEEVVHAPDGMRLVRAIRRSTDDDARIWWHLYAPSRRADDDGSQTSRKELLLEDHLRRTETWASRIARSLSLPEAEGSALTLAARVHDLGKRRRVWQRSIQRFIEPPLAKGRMQPLQLGHYRHELGSLHDGDFGGLDAQTRDLAMHLVAAHHGRARPHFPRKEAYDPELDEQLVADLVSEVPRRFDRLQRRYGRWGLAWLESLLRIADVLGSEEEEVEA